MDGKLGEALHNLLLIVEKIIAWNTDFGLENQKTLLTEIQEVKKILVKIKRHN